MLEGALTFEGNTDVRSAAVRAATSFLCDNEEDPHLLRAFVGLTPLILRVSFLPTLESKKIGCHPPPHPMVWYGHGSAIGAFRMKSTSYVN